MTIQSFFPKPGRRKCLRHDPRIMCEERWEAVRAKAFRYDHDREGWIVADAPPRRVNWTNVWRIGGAAPDSDGQPYIWLDCPWCGGELPSLTSAIDNLWRTDGTGDDT